MERVLIHRRRRLRPGQSALATGWRGTPSWSLRGWPTRALLAAFLWLVATRSGRAEPIAAGDDIAAFDMAELLGQVVGASGRAESLFKAPATVTVIDEEAIRLSAARAIPELFRSVPGMQVMEIAPGNYAVSVRGTGSLQGNNLIVVVDGVAINTPFDGNVDWSLAPALADVARIEVVRGPVSPIYGANAYTGMIVIQTRSPAERPGLSGEVRLGGGLDLAPQPTSALHSALTGRHARLAWRLSASGRFDQTFTSQPSVPEEQPQLKQASIAGRLSWTPAPRTEIALDGAASLSEASASDSLVLDPLPQRGQAAQARLAATRLDLAPWLPLVQLWTSARLFHRSADEQRYIGFAYERARAYDWLAGFDVDLAPAKSFSLKLGAESGFTHVTASFIHPEEDELVRWRHAARVQANLELAKKLLFEAAARADVSDFTDGLKVSYRASAIHYGGSYSVRLTAGSAFRSPSYVEAVSRFIDPRSGLIQLEGLADLRPPRLESLELAGIVALWGARVTLRPTCYLARAIDLVVSDFEPLVRNTFRNDPTNVFVLGGEMELEAQLAPWLSARAAGSIVSFIGDQDDPSATVGVPGHNARFSGSLALKAILQPEALELGVSAMLISERTYDVRAGIPPVLLHTSTYRFSRASKRARAGDRAMPGRSGYVCSS